MGVDLRADHGDSTLSSDVITDCLDEADALLDMHLEKFYDHSDLEGNNVVILWATRLAAYLLCERRLNAVPSQLESWWEKLLGPGGMAEQAGSGRFNLGVAPSVVDQPAMGNVTIWPGYRNAKVRRQDDISVGGGSEVQQNNEPSEYLWEH